MKVIKASTNAKDQEWRAVNDVIMLNMTPEIKQAWDDDGYEGISKLVCSHFGINQMYRDEEQSMTFVFTNEQWTWFVMRWL